MAKKIFIIGIGRSGTTAIYSILQRIIRIQLQKGVEFVYEPFLWDRSVFNKMYTDINDEFDNVSSLSVQLTFVLESPVKTFTIIFSFCKLSLSTICKGLLIRI